MQINHSGNQYPPLRPNIAEQPRPYMKQNQIPNAGTGAPGVAPPRLQNLRAPPPPAAAAQRGATRGAPARPRARPLQRSPARPRRTPGPGQAAATATAQPLTMVPVPPGPAVRPSFSREPAPRRSPNELLRNGVTAAAASGGAACWEPQSGLRPPGAHSGCAPRLGRRCRL